jgi:aldehyde dehydrogenase (NAD+)
MELSGCDAVFVLPGAELEHLARAIGFGLRFNGSFTCMAPRRMFLVGLSEVEVAQVEARLAAMARELAPVPLPAKTEELLQELVEDARGQGAEIALDGLEDRDDPRGAGATLICRATPAMRAMQADIFAPVLSVMRTADLGETLAANGACPYALTAAIFGPVAEARRLAGRLRVGNVLINDIVIPTVDPRVAFGGRGRSGFGVTRGAEGLLAMTTPRTVQVQHGRIPFPYQAAGDGHVGLFAGLAKMLYGDGIGNRWDGLKRLVRAARNLR